MAERVDAPMYRDQVGGPYSGVDRLPPEPGFAQLAAAQHSVLVGGELREPPFPLRPSSPVFGRGD
jgi:hypothetical protein